MADTCPEVDQKTLEAIGRCEDCGKDTEPNGEGGFYRHCRPCAVDRAVRKMKQAEADRQVQARLDKQRLKVKRDAQVGEKPETCEHGHRNIDRCPLCLRDSRGMSGAKSLYIDPGHAEYMAVYGEDPNRDPWTDGFRPFWDRQQPQQPQQPQKPAKPRKRPSPIEPRPRPKPSERPRQRPSWTRQYRRTS